MAWVQSLVVGTEIPQAAQHGPKTTKTKLNQNKTLKLGFIFINHGVYQRLISIINNTVVYLYFQFTKYFYSLQDVGMVEVSC